MAPSNKWVSCLILCVFSLRTIETSYVSDSFYSQLLNLFNHIPQPQETQEIGEVTEVSNWPTASIPHLGQISGVSVNPVNQPVIFHRGPRIWDIKSFNETNHFQQIADGPISVDTVITLDPETGGVLSSWGSNLFYLPHGIHIDFEGNTWLTDVALHQVFKFSPGSNRPVLTFGQRWKPGVGLGHLCKPSAVVVAQNGDVFIADGYCNSRILKFNHYGELIRVFPQKQEFINLEVPHSLALLERAGLLCIADRDNMRVVCINAELEDSIVQSPLNIQQPDLGRVFAIANRGDLVFAVNGPTSPHLSIQGFIIDPLSEMIEGHWKPTSDVFHEPHDLAVSPDGSFLYVVELMPHRLWKFNI